MLVYLVIANFALFDTRLGLILYYAGSGMQFAIFYWCTDYVITSPVIGSGKN